MHCGKLDSVVPTTARQPLTSIEIRPASVADIEAAAKLLGAAQLPVADLSQRSPEDFLVARVGDTFAGFIGMEQYGEKGLLRSLVVDPAFRGAGLGRVLVAALESHANSRGVNELWLLTIDADAWFAKLDYEVHQRHDAPESIQNTDEFSELCPGDAVLMSKAI